MTLKKLNRLLSFIVGGLGGILLLVLIILDLVNGKSIDISSVFGLFICFSGAVWGFKELRVED
jgi:hypothetical protein